ncbi:MAG: DUF3179 domain-containing protein [Chloroflexota bacterium]
MIRWQKFLFVLLLPILIACSQTAVPETAVSTEAAEPEAEVVVEETEVEESTEDTNSSEDESMTDEEMDEEMADEEMADEEMDEEVMEDESMADEEMDEEMADEEMADEIIPIDDEEAKELMFLLSNGSPEEAAEAVERIIEADDERFIGVFIELFRARQIGLTRVLGVDEIVSALLRLSDAQNGNNWDLWVEWYGTTDLTVPDGFVSWKGQMLSLIDVRFGAFLQDRHPINVRPEEIMWGGVLVDGIPPLDYPAMITPEQADYLDPWDPVFGMSINGDSRAYPLRIIDWHEMANDVIGGVPVSIAYCTLCGAAVAYDGRGSDGTDYDFSSSGFLFRSNKLMYDRQTNTLWNQLTGEPVLGELVDSDIELDLLPIVLTTWEAWQEQHPDTVVVDENTGISRDYTLGSAYGDYFSSQFTMFPVWQRDDRQETKDFVYTLNIDDTPKAYPVELLAEEGVVNDVLADTAITLIAARGVVESEGLSRRAGPVTYSSGAEVRAYERGDETFSPGPDADTVIDSSGQTWQVTEEALVGPNGETLERISGHLAYWFGWFAFYPETLLYEN